MRTIRRRSIIYLAGALLIVLAILLAATILSLHPVDEQFARLESGTVRARILDRHGELLARSYQNRWNLDDFRPLPAIPESLQRAIIASEDRRFYHHHGIDWPARLSALWLNFRKAEAVRGASTITEQVVRMIDPRPRTLWSRWLEGWEAMRLEHRFPKPLILEFYLNQAPYARQWRGVVQASRGYFDRDPGTLSTKEQLALAVLLRAPTALDPLGRGDGKRLDRAIRRLGARMIDQGLLPETERSALGRPLRLSPGRPPAEAGPALAVIRKEARPGTDVIRSTLDAGLQHEVSRLLSTRLQSLADKRVGNAAALVADHRTGEILAWVVAGSGDASRPSGAVDAVLVPRQPGSALKPFLYAQALEKGWTPATLIDDAPFEEAVGTGLHAFNNYSRTYHGLVPLREALANSLNVPAVKTIGYVGVGPYLRLLHRLGFASLQAEADVYDEGLALGNGAVTLRELVGGYASLANRGVYRPLRIVVGRDEPADGKPAVSPEAASLIGDILSDPYARQWEFGENSVLNLPVQTAVKTGTSTAYRDAWAVGYDSRYVVGIWMGNLDNRPMEGVTGSIGPSLTLRAIFAHLGKSGEARPLWRSPRLVRERVCLPLSGPFADCTERPEWFLPGHPWQSAEYAEPQKQDPFRILRPTEGLRLAYDPRIPPANQAFRMRLAGVADGERVTWLLDGETAGESAGAEWRWPVRRGEHRVSARRANGDTTPPVRFVVR